MIYIAVNVRLYIIMVVRIHIFQILAAIRLLLIVVPLTHGHISFPHLYRYLLRAILFYCKRLLTLTIFIVIIDLYFEMFFSLFRFVLLVILGLLFIELFH